MRFLNKSNKLSLLITVTLSLFFVYALSVYGSWIPPTKAPQGGNRANPLTPTRVGQVKLGGLILNFPPGVSKYGLRVLGDVGFPGLKCGEKKDNHKGPVGCVGIGVKSPAEKLDIRGDLNLSGIFKPDGKVGEINDVLVRIPDAKNVKNAKMTWGRKYDWLTIYSKEPVWKDPIPPPTKRDPKLPPGVCGNNKVEGRETCDPPGARCTEKGILGICSFTCECSLRPPEFWSPPVIVNPPKISGPCRAIGRRNGVAICGGFCLDSQEVCTNVGTTCGCVKKLPKPKGCRLNEDLSGPKCGGECPPGLVCKKIEDPITKAFCECQSPLPPGKINRIDKKENLASNIETIKSSFDNLGLINQSFAQTTNDCSLMPRPDKCPTGWKTHSLVCVGAAKAVISWARNCYR